MKAFALLFALYVLFQPLIPLGVYVVNYDYIVKNLCVNRDKPKMHCNGKCYLAKKMADASTHEGTTESKLSFLKEFNFTYFQELNQFVFRGAEDCLKHAITDRYSNGYAYLTEFSFFHPPAFVY